MSEIVNNLPVIALRGMTILPYMVIHFDVSRKKSVNSVEYAMKNGQKLFVITQKSPDIMNPERDDLYDFGTICEIKQIVKLQGGLERVLVKGMHRGKLTQLTDESNMLIAEVEQCDEATELAQLSDADCESRLLFLKDLMKIYYRMMDRDQGDNIPRIQIITNLNEIIFKCVAECTTEYPDRQKILEADDMKNRFDMTCDILAKEIEIVNIKSELADGLKKRIDTHQKEYVLREQIQAIKKELGDVDTGEADEYRARVEKLTASEEIKDKIYNEIKKYETQQGSNAENSVTRNYIETLLDLPWDYYTEDKKDIKKAEAILEKDHYGLTKVKERMIEHLAVRTLAAKGDSPIICLVGPPGTGKTSIAESVARAVGKKYVRICLGGVRDEAEIRGHRRTYIGSMPGRIIEGLKNAGAGNPLMLLDEIDKTGSDSRGDTASALLEILDSAQNSAFRDHYVELPVDLSEVMFIATANDTSTISRPLLDRMEVIEINTYMPFEKFNIAKKYLLPKQIRKNGLKKEQLSINKEAIMTIINNYTKEAGVRELERKIAKICRKAAKEILSGEQEIHKVTAKNLEHYLGVPRFDDEEASAHDEVGIVKGLAWTSVGGTTLDVEAALMPGKGNITLTGKLGDVMKESASVAYGYLKSNAAKYAIDYQVIEKNDIQIHVPEGAVPKDGPSAGITITLAMLSALTGRKVRHDTAMTGEITLHGKVLPIGGLKEKLLAARTIGIKRVLVPFKNRKDVEEIEKEVTDGMNILFMETMDDVIENALRK